MSFIFNAMNRVGINKQSRGQTAEALACAYLQKQGLRLVVRNFRCKMGEIDLVMSDHHHLVFVEVRYRRSVRYGSAIESVTFNKQRRLQRAAYYYLQSPAGLQQSEVTYRFDIVGIKGLDTDLQIEWIKNAFTG